MDDTASPEASGDGERAARIIAAALDRAFTSERGNVADAIFDVADAGRILGRSVQRLGLADAATSLGALEVVSMAIETGFRAVADAVFEALRERELVA